MAATSSTRPERTPAFPLRRVAGWQASATLLIAALAGFWAGWHGALSAVLGGLVNISAGAVFTVLIAINAQPTAAATVRTMLRAEAGKIIAIVLQLWLVLTSYGEVVHAAFFSAFVVTVLVSQAAILVQD
ncbi:MAG: ATP synthase subunit I [Betaproteobacteria bacterium]